jgi:hypothetical protein
LLRFPKTGEFVSRKREPLDRLCGRISVVLTGQINANSALIIHTILREMPVSAMAKLMFRMSVSAG